MDGWLDGWMDGRKEVNSHLSLLIFVTQLSTLDIIRIITLVGCSSGILILIFLSKKTEATIVSKLISRIMEKRH